MLYWGLFKVLDNGWVSPFMPAITQRYQLKADGGGRLLPQRLQRALLPSDTLPVGALTTPCGKCSSLWETATFPHQDLFHPTGNKGLREDGGEARFLSCFVPSQPSGFFLH